MRDLEAQTEESNLSKREQLLRPRQEECFAGMIIQAETWGRDSQAFLHAGRRLLFVVLVLSLANTILIGESRVQSHSDKLNNYLAIAAVVVVIVTAILTSFETVYKYKERGIAQMTAYMKFQKLLANVRVAELSKTDQWKFFKENFAECQEQAISSELLGLQKQEVTKKPPDEKPPDVKASGSNAGEEK